MRETVSSRELGNGSGEKFEILYVRGTSTGIRSGNQDRSQTSKAFRQISVVTSDLATFRRSPIEQLRGHVSDNTIFEIVDENS